VKLGNSELVTLAAVQSANPAGLLMLLPIFAVLWHFQNKKVENVINDPVNML